MSTKTTAKLVKPPDLTTSLLRDLAVRLADLERAQTGARLSGCLTRLTDLEREQAEDRLEDQELDAEVAGLTADVRQHTGRLDALERAVVRLQQRPSWWARWFAWLDRQIA